MDVGEGVHPTLGEDALGEDAPLAELLCPVGSTPHDDACRADTRDEDDAVLSIDIDLPEVIGEVRVFSECCHQVVDGACGGLAVDRAADDGEVSGEGGGDRDGALALRDVVALARLLLDDVEGEALYEAYLHRGGGGSDEGFGALVDGHGEERLLDLTEIDGVQALAS